MSFMLGVKFDQKTLTFDKTRHCFHLPVLCEVTANSLTKRVVKCMQQLHNVSVSYT